MLEMRIGPKAAVSVTVVTKMASRVCIAKGSKQTTRERSVVRMSIEPTNSFARQPSQHQFCVQMHRIQVRKPVSEHSETNWQKQQESNWQMLQSSMQSDAFCSASPPTATGHVRDECDLLNRHVVASCKQTTDALMAFIKSSPGTFPVPV